MSIIVHGLHFSLSSNNFMSLRSDVLNRLQSSHHAVDLAAVVVTAINPPACWYR